MREEGAAPYGLFLTETLLTADDVIKHWADRFGIRILTWSLLSLSHQSGEYSRAFLRWMKLEDSITVVRMGSSKSCFPFLFSLSDSFHQILFYPTLLWFFSTLSQQRITTFQAYNLSSFTRNDHIDFNFRSSVYFIDRQLIFNFIQSTRFSFFCFFIHFKRFLIFKIGSSIRSKRSETCNLRPRSSRETLSHLPKRRGRERVRERGKGFGLSYWWVDWLLMKNPLSCDIDRLSGECDQKQRRGAW